MEQWGGVPLEVRREAFKSMRWKKSEVLVFYGFSHKHCHPSQCGKSSGREKGRVACQGFRAWERNLWKTLQGEIEGSLRGVGLHASGNRVAREEAKGGWANVDFLQDHGRRTVQEGLGPPFRFLNTAIV